MHEFEPVYQKWLERSTSREINDELSTIAGNIPEIQDRFYRNLEFGTGGIRGLIGAGPNRINTYTIRKTTLGLAQLILKLYPRHKSKVIIAYDSRHKSREFALETALVLAKNKIQALVFQEIAPTPLLSFGVRELQATAGVVITASHNPKEYNGYKVYAGHGGQITDNLAQAVTQEIYCIADEFAIETMEQKEAEAQGLLIWLQDEILERYLTLTENLLLNKRLVQEYASELNIVYTPLYGTGLKPVRKILQDTGFTNLHIVKEQAEANPDFPSLVCPNPEDPAACSLALREGILLGADLILATDLDADRVGIFVKNQQGHFVSLSGNQTGALLIDYILHMRKRHGTLPPNGVIVKTMVTSGLGAAVAQKYGIGCMDVLPGFKYIGEKISEFDQNKLHTFLFGYEESFGYLIGEHVRDKDGIQTCLCIAEMALYYKKQGITLYERLNQIYNEAGYYAEDLLNLEFSGVKGQLQIKRIMDSFRAGPPEKLKNLGLISCKDYLESAVCDYRTGQTSRLDFPRANILYYSLAKGAWSCIRPSGTEPKLKVYVGAVEKTREEALRSIRILKQTLLGFIHPLVS